MKNITYVTGNYGKYIGVKEKFEKENIKIDYFKYDLDEPNINDIKIISKEKAREAYNLLQKPVFVTDSGFYIEAYPNNPGYPGAFVKRSGVSSDVSSLLEIMKNINNRSCYFEDCLTFYDGTNYYQFFGINKGRLSYEVKGKKTVKAESNLWHVFIPANCTKTLLEMTDEEREKRKDNRTSAIDEFIVWYKTNYQSSK